MLKMDRNFSADEKKGKAPQFPSSLANKILAQLLLES